MTKKLTRRAAMIAVVICVLAVSYFLAGPFVLSRAMESSFGRGFYAPITYSLRKSSCISHSFVWWYYYDICHMPYMFVVEIPNS